MINNKKTILINGKFKIFDNASPKLNSRFPKIILDNTKDFFRS